MIDPSWAKGIDVSHWDRVKDFSAIPVDVVIFAAKATEGEAITDQAFAYHRDGARARGFDLCCWYHVARPGDPVVHAQRLVDVVGPLAPGECLVLDTERGSAVDVDYIDGFYRAIESLGAATPHDLWYGSVGSWPGGIWSRADRVGLWAPRYRSGGAPPHLPTPWTTWRLFQWTDGGATGDPYSCPGVGTCDASVFHGNRDALRAFVSGA